MSKRYPSDFIPCRPWGNIGDRKNDGYLPSKRTLYQVYAPNEMTMADAITKIREDFDGAKQHWRQYFDNWVFVHNDPRGRLSPGVLELLLELKRDTPGVNVTHMGIEELRLELNGIDVSSLETWFGLVPTEQDNVQIGFPELQVVLEHVHTNFDRTPSDARPVPYGKIEYNLISPASIELLKLGMAKANMVGEFFSKCRNPKFGDQVASAFKARYEDLKSQTPLLSSDVILGEITQWAENGSRDLKVKMAALVVIAYLFDACEIFEAPPLQFSENLLVKQNDPA